MTYTDFLDNPISEGDTIVYAISSGHGGSAALEKAVVHRIIPLVLHPTPRKYAGYTPTEPDLAREDQLNKKDPTHFSGARYDAPEKRYVIQVMRNKWRYQRDSEGRWQGMELPTRFTVPNSQHVVVV